MTIQTWRTSSYSGAENNCVEVAPHGDEWKIRDSKNRSGGALSCNRKAFAELLKTVKAFRSDVS